LLWEKTILGLYTFLLFFLCGFKCDSFHMLVNIRCGLKAMYCWYLKLTYTEEPLSHLFLLIS